ncbi:Protein CBG05836 [Caenorhabditis briggsae]|uniref:ZZ-type domain-containing protein n=2 Tax=Caenorhabditis briggsae TaxID=6238 RepID=A0AAE9D6P3_CAEBR|nr:Protein CBG05836 [Caenorhabditis briggsae]ULT95066.1 hypothetical protein L3Y34_004066 [Caenorhabditis briggsae]UMM28274.1 hypothetical protein L5515_011187 [Caenorhabditis briggsae]CAP26496.1 Protein CBG05836 [Caenorhabditis briggsae]
MSSLRYRSSIRRPQLDGYTYERSRSASAIPQDIHVTFYNNSYQRAKTLYLNKYNAMEKIIEAAHELFPSDRIYRFFSDRTLGARNELTDSYQVMDSIQNPHHILPQLFIRLEETSRRASIHNNQYEVIPIIRTPSQVSHRHSVRFDDRSRAHSSASSHANFHIYCCHCHFPIHGIRYHCLECPDYDICENCEKDLVHFEHALIRIVSPRYTRIPDYVISNAPSYVFPEDRYYVERAI